MKPDIPQTHTDSELGGLNDVSVDAEQWSPDRRIGSVSSDQYPEVPAACNTEAACNTKIHATIVYHKKESLIASQVKKEIEEHIRNDSGMSIELKLYDGFGSSPFLKPIQTACKCSQIMILLWTKAVEDDDFYRDLSLTVKTHANRHKSEVIVIYHGFDDTREPNELDNLAISDTTPVEYNSTDFLPTMTRRLSEAQIQQSKGQEIMNKPTPPSTVSRRQPCTGLVQSATVPKHRADKDETSNTDLPCDVSDDASQSGPALQSNAASSSSVSASSQDTLSLQRQPQMQVNYFAEVSKTNLTEKSACTSANSTNEEENEDIKYRKMSNGVGNDDVSCKNKPVSCDPAAQRQKCAGDAEGKIDKTNPIVLPAHDPEEMDLSNESPETGIAKLPPNTKSGSHEYKCMEKEPRHQDARAVMNRLAQTGTQDIISLTSTSVEIGQRQPNTTLDQPDAVPNHGKDRDHRADTDLPRNVLSDAASQTSPAPSTSVSSLSASSQDMLFFQKQPPMHSKCFVEASKNNPMEKPLFATVHNSNEEDNKDRKYRNEPHLVKNDEVNCKSKLTANKPAAQMQTHAGGDVDAKINETDPASLPPHAYGPKETDLSNESLETGITGLPPNTEDDSCEYKSMGKKPRSQDDRAEMMQNETLNSPQTQTQDIILPTSTSAGTSLDQPDTILKHRKDGDQTADTGPLDNGLSHIVSQANPDLHGNPESCSSLSASSQDMPVLEKKPQAQAKNFVESKTNPTEKPVCASAHNSNKEDKKDRKYRNESNWVENDDVGAKNKLVTGKPAAQMQTHAEGKMEETSSPPSLADDPKETDLSNESPDTGIAELPPNTKDGGHEYESMGGEASNVETPDNSTISDLTPPGSEGHTMKTPKESSNSDSTSFVDTVCESQYNHKCGYGLKTNTIKHLQSHDSHATADESNMKSSKESEFSQNKHFCHKRDPTHRSTDSEHENSRLESKLSPLTIHTSNQDKRNRNKRGIEDVPEELPGEAGNILHAESEYEETLLKSPVDIQTDGTGVNQGMEGEIKRESLSKHTIDAGIDGIFSSPCGGEIDDSTNKIMFTGDEYNNTSSRNINRSGMKSKATSENYQTASLDCLPKRREETHPARNSIEMLSTGFQVQMNSMLDGTTHEIHPQSPASAGEGGLKPLRGPLLSEVEHRISDKDLMYKEPIQESCPPRSLPSALESAAGNSNTGTKTHPCPYQNISVDKESTVISQPSSPTGQAYQSAIVFNIARSDHLEISVNKNGMQVSGASDLSTLHRKSGGESTTSATRNGAMGDTFGNNLQTDSENTQPRDHSFTSKLQGLFCCSHKKYKKPKKPGKRRKVKE